MQEEAETLLASIVSALPTSDSCLDEYCRAQLEDAEVIKRFREGWPSKHHIHSDLHAYWEVRGNLTLANNLLHYGSHIVVPASLRKVTLSGIHHGHLGMQKCQL